MRFKQATAVLNRLLFLSKLGLVNKLIAFEFQGQLGKQGQILQYKHLTSLKNLPSAAPSESFPYRFQGNFAVCLY